MNNTNHLQMIFSGFTALILRSKGIGSYGQKKNRFRIDGIGLLGMLCFPTCKLRNISSITS